MAEYVASISAVARGDLAWLLPRRDDGDKIFKLVGYKRTRKITRNKPFEVGKTYKDKRGYDVRIVADDYRSYAGNYPLVGLVSVGEHQYIEVYTIDGTLNPSRGFEKNLIPETETITESYLEEIEE